MMSGQPLLRLRYCCPIRFMALFSLTAETCVSKSRTSSFNRGERLRADSTSMVPAAQSAFNESFIVTMLSARPVG